MGLLQAAGTWNLPEQTSASAPPTCQLPPGLLEGSIQQPTPPFHPTAIWEALRDFQARDSWAVGQTRKSKINLPFCRDLILTETSRNLGHEGKPSVFSEHLLGRDETCHQLHLWGGTGREAANGEGDREHRFPQRLTQTKPSTALPPTLHTDWQKAMRGGICQQYYSRGCQCWWISSFPFPIHSLLELNKDFVQAQSLTYSLN